MVSIEIRITKRLFHIFCFLLLCYGARSQSNEDLIIINETCQPVEVKNDTLFYPDSLQQKYIKQGWLLEYSQPPEFPGGEKALIEFFKEHTIYPEKAIEARIEGLVMMKLSITPDGCIGKLGFIKSVPSELKTECIRVVKKLPRFKPGLFFTKTKKGWFWKPVTVWYMVSVNFSLSDDISQRGIIIKPKK